MKNKFLKFFTSQGNLKVLSSLLCILFGLLIGFIILLCISAPDASYEFGVLITGGIEYGGLETIGDILARTAPLLCCGLCVVFAYKTGLFNIGVAGQYTMGAFGALIFALQFHMHWSLCLLMAGVFGALWACIPALLKVFCHVNEVIAGIMCNWISLFFVNYSFQTYLKDCVNVRQGAKTYEISGISKLPDMGLSDTLGRNFSISIFVAVILMIIIWVVLSKTTLGYQLKASGMNRDATKYAGMDGRRNVIITMAIAGALAGIGAGLYYLNGLEQWGVAASTSLPSLPWNGIVVAFLAQISPIGALFASLFISIISTGSKCMTQTIFPAEIGDLVTGIIVYLSGLTAFFLTLIGRLKRKLKEKKEMELAAQTNSNVESQIEQTEPTNEDDSKGGNENA